ncbi:MAG: protein kinase [Gemmatimonadetes bacterium]|nr:protein kinase [Gemmatimonadota bacterium]
MATVYLATDLKHQRQVAIKVLRPELAATVGPERFVREIQIAAQLSHPHVVALLDSGVAARPDGAGEILYYVMPYVAGESLRGRLERGPVPVGEAVRLLVEVADALAYAHAQGIVHRDIKPENIMLSGRHAVVMDFGVARAVREAADGARMTSAGFALGTPAYMAPEQASGDPDVDHRADLYALGIVAYELLSGRLPYQGTTPQQLLAAHVVREPEPLAQVRPGLPAGLAEIIMRCLAKAREARWASAEELRDALEGLGPLGVVTPAAGPGVAAPPADRSPAQVALLAAGAGAVILGAVAVLVRQLGLPDWVLTGAIALLLLGLPAAIGTAVLERRRAALRATGTWHASGETGLARAMTWRRVRRGGVAAFGGLGLAAAAYMAMRVLGIGPVGTLVASGRLAAQDRIVIADFVSRGGDSALGPSVAEALRIDIGQSPVVRVLGAPEIRTGLVRMGRPPETRLDLATTRELALREGAKAYLVGEVSPAGRGYLLNARLLAVAGDEELVALRETADDDGAVLHAIDRLSKRLRERLGESLRDVRDAPPLEKVTTSSLEALRLYSEAKRLMRSGSRPEIEGLFNQAIALDSGFAGAWRGLAVFYFNIGAPRSRQVHAATMAFRGRDRLPEQERNFTAAAYYWNVEQDYERARQAYEAVLAREPGHAPSLNNLALVHMRLRRWGVADSLLRMAVSVDSGLTSPYVNWVEVLGRRRQLDRADSVLALMRRRLPPGLGYYSSAWDVAAQRRDWAAVESLAVVAAEAAPAPGGRAWTLDVRGAVSAIAGRVELAGQRLRQAGQLVDAAGRLNHAMWALDLDAEYDVPAAAAARALDQVLARQPLESLPPADRPYPELALRYAMYGRPDRARALLAEQLAADSTATPASRGRGLAEAWVALAERRYDEGLARLRALADSSLCANCDSYLLARAYDLAGRPDSALAAWTRAVEQPADWEQFYEDGLSLPRAYRRLGELHEERGDRARALDYYGRLVALWREADPKRQAEVRRIRERMARLAGE